MSDHPPKVLSYVQHLLGIGLFKRSATLARVAAGVVASHRRTDIHVDPIDWPITGGRVVCDGIVLGAALPHLHRRRAGAADPNVSTWLMTHHLAHNDARWAFIDIFLAATSEYSTARSIDAPTTCGLY